MPKPNALLKALWPDEGPAVETRTTISEPQADALPTDLKAAFELLAKINNLPDGQRDKEARLNRIRAHVHRLQQGPAPVVFDANAQAQCRNTQVEQNPAKPLGLALPAQWRSGQTFGGQPMNPIITKLRAEAEIQPLKASFVSSMEVYEAACLARLDELYPADAASRRSAAIMDAPDLASRQKLQEEIARFTGAGAENAKFAARRECLLAYGPVTVAALALLDKASSLAAGYLTQALADEKGLFDKWAMPPEATSISTRIRAVISELAAIRQSMVNWEQPGMVSHLPSYSNSPVTQFFGITF